MPMSLGLGTFLGSAVSSAANFVGGLQANAQNAKENQKNREWNEKMWHLNNEYNLPQNQMMRLKSAGLNPNLVYGQGTSTLSSYAGNLGANQRMENPAKGINLDVASAAAMSLQQKQTASNIKVNDSQERLNDANTVKATAEAEESKERATRQRIQNTYADMNEIVDLAIKGNTQTAGILANQFAAQKNPLEIEQLVSHLDILAKEGKIKEETVKLIKEQINTQKAETNLVNEKSNTERSAQRLNNALRGKAVAEGYAALKQGDYYASATALNHELKKLQPFQRMELASKAYYDIMNGIKAGADTKLSEQQKKKLATDTKIAIQQGNLDVLVKTRTPFGSGIYGDVLNLLYMGITDTQDIVNGVNKNINYIQDK